VSYSEDYFLSITPRLGKKTIYGWTLGREKKVTYSAKKYHFQDLVCEKKVDLKALSGLFL
jgi:hypothetical protein